MKLSTFTHRFIAWDRNRIKNKCTKLETEYWLMITILILKNTYMKAATAMTPKVSFFNLCKENMSNFELDVIL